MNILYLDLLKRSVNKVKNVVLLLLPRFLFLKGWSWKVRSIIKSPPKYSKKYSHIFKRVTLILKALDIKAPLTSRKVRPLSWSLKILTPCSKNSSVIFKNVTLVSKSHKMPFFVSTPHKIVSQSEIRALNLFSQKYLKTLYQVRYKGN